MLLNPGCRCRIALGPYERLAVGLAACSHSARVCCTVGITIHSFSNDDHRCQSLPLLAGTVRSVTNAGVDPETAAPPPFALSQLASGLTRSQNGGCDAVDGSRYALVAVALLCVLTLGTAATTLESAVTTDPADEIDIDWDSVPIGQSTAADIREAIEEESSSATDTAETDLDGDSEAPAERDAESDRSAGASSSASDAGDSGSAATAETLWDRLLALFAALLRVLIPIAAILALALLAYRYRERLRGRLTRTSPDDASGILPASRWPDGEPVTAVDRAWVAMVRAAGPERPETMTPAECAVAARESGLNEEAVELITSAFERVHYGGASADDFTESAQRALQRLDGHPEATAAVPIGIATREGPQ